VDINLRVNNSKQHPVKFYLEPWGEEFDLAAGEEIVVRLSGPEPAVPEVDVAQESITVWAWSGSTVRLFQRDEELGVSPRWPVPDEGLAAVREIFRKAGLLQGGQSESE
jgi:hypothetical protein